MTLRWERIPILGKVYTKNARRFPDTVRFGNIVQGLPLPDASCDAVFASHVLEHLALADFHRALDNTKRILRKGGVFRLVVPDLEYAAREYVAKLEHDDPTANLFFLHATLLGAETRSRGLSGLVHKWLNTSQHLWMWDALSLGHALESHGFASVRRCRFGDSDDDLFALVEDKGRFKNAVALEARA
jgi:SAM-dependent methyltransferase